MTQWLPMSLIQYDGTMSYIVNFFFQICRFPLPLNNNRILVWPQTIAQPNADLRGNWKINKHRWKLYKIQTYISIEQNTLSHKVTITNADDQVTHGAKASALFWTRSPAILWPQGQKAKFIYHSWYWVMIATATRKGSLSCMIMFWIKCVTTTSQLPHFSKRTTLIWKIIWG